MVSDPDGIPGPPAGFPNCERCPYLVNGPVRVCVTCAGHTISALAQPHCPICSQAVAPGEVCRNALCRRQARHITRINAISVYSGELANSIKRLKYQGRYGWAVIFGRLVAGWLADNRSALDYDLIVSNPTFRYPSEPPGLGQHTEMVLRSASYEDMRNVWPFEPELLSLAFPVQRSATATAADKQSRAELRYQALRVRDTGRLSEARVLVYDDVCTTGQQLDAVARFLRNHGARSVEGLVLARAPWR